MNAMYQRKWQEAQERARIFEELGRNFAFAVVATELMMPFGIIISFALGFLK